MHIFPNNKSRYNLHKVKRAHIQSKNSDRICIHLSINCRIDHSSTLSFLYTFSSSSSSSSSSYCRIPLNTHYYHLYSEHYSFFSPPPRNHFLIDEKASFTAASISSLLSLDVIVSIVLSTDGDLKAACNSIKYILVLTL